MNNVLKILLWRFTNVAFLCFRYSYIFMYAAFRVSKNSIFNTPQRIFRTLLLFSSAVMLVTFSAQAQQALTVDLAQDHVDITTGFNGAELTLFGVQDEPGDIAIVMTGPKRDVVVRKKKRVLGVWTNVSGLTFEDVPGFYDYALAVDEDVLAEPSTLKQAGIGKPFLRFDADEDDEEKLKNFQNGLIRNMQAEGMFPSEPKPLEFLNDHFFRTTFELPSNVPTGLYMIKTFLIREGRVVEAKETTVKVAQVGNSARVYLFAQERSVSYGVLCVIFAMIIGWFSNAISRRQ